MNHGIETNKPWVLSIQKVWNKESKKYQKKL